MLISILLHDTGISEGLLPVTDNLVLYVDASNVKSFDPSVQNATWNDISSPDSPKKGVLNGNAKYVNTDGGILFFDGFKDYVDFPADDDFKFGTGSFSLFYTVKFNQFSNSPYGTVFDFRTPGSDQAGISDYWFSSGGRGGLGLWDNGGDVVNGSTPSFAPKTWLSVGYTHDSVNKVSSLYFNGVKDTDAGFWRDTFNYTSHRLRLGANEGGSSINGSISAFLVYKGKALNASEIKATHDALMPRFQ